MARQYLDVPFKQKDSAKALGARWDGAARRWYVEDGGDLAEFHAWLPADAGSSQARDLAVAPSPPAGGVVSSQPLTLSRLLRGVEMAVSEAFRTGVWTLVEVVDVKSRNHIYLELAERDANGEQIAKAGGMIWANVAAQILPAFERETGAVLGPGIKLLVQAKPGFKANFGFRIEISAIDSQYTLGDLEARKKEIRERLKREGVFDSNKHLAAPFDYLDILVVAPEEGAGLGDFRKEAERLGRYGICRFSYIYSRFQGEGAAREIVSALSAAMDALPPGKPPDAIVMIRGGGAVNDLAWLNDYDLARYICDLPVPVLTGIGHERDSTLPDEVAHARFDTPSKVIAGIEQLIISRVREARSAAEMIFTSAERIVQRKAHDTERLNAEVHSGARLNIGMARETTEQAMAQIKLDSMAQLHQASASSASGLHQVMNDSARHLAAARQEVPGLLATIRLRASGAVARARQVSGSAFDAVLNNAGRMNAGAARDIDERMRNVAERAQNNLQRSRTNAEALMREITGQGPDKTLNRGFAIIRAPDGTAITSARQAAAIPTFDIQLRDGTVEVHPAAPPSGKSP